VQDTDFTIKTLPGNKCFTTSISGQRLSSEVTALMKFVLEADCPRKGNQATSDAATNSHLRRARAKVEHFLGSTLPFPTNLFALQFETNRHIEQRLALHVIVDE
jgi:hypothetical protein